MSGLDPKAVPFWSPATIRRSAVGKASSTLSVDASEFVDPGAALENERFVDDMADFMLELELAQAVIELGEDEQAEANTAIDTAEASENIKVPAVSGDVTDDQLAADGELFVLENKIVEAEQDADPDATSGITEAEAMSEHYSVRPTKKSVTDSEVAAEAEAFQLENEIVELEEQLINEDEASTALEVMDAHMAHEELVLEEQIASVVMAMGAEEQSETNLHLESADAVAMLPKATDAEIENEAAAFELNNAIAEAEQNLDPEQDPAEGLSEASAMLQQYASEAPPTEAEIANEAALFQLENQISQAEAEAANEGLGQVDAQTQ